MWQRFTASLPRAVTVSQAELATALQGLDHLRISPHKSAFGVCHGQIQALYAVEENAIRIGVDEMHPAIFKAGLPVQRQRGRRLRGVRKKDAQPHHDLKAVADAENQSASIAELVEYLAQVNHEPLRQNATCCNIIPIAKATWEAEYLMRFAQRRLLDQTVDMHARDAGADLFKSVGRFFVAVRTGGSQD